MATNGNNGPRMTYTGQPDIGQGIGGQLQSRAIKNQFSQDFWGREGYLNTAISELEQQQKLYEEMNKISEQMTKRDQKAIKDKLLAYKQQLAILRTIKKEQEVSDLEALDLMKSSNKLLEKGQQKYIELLNDENDIIEDNNDLRLDGLDAAIEKQKELNGETKNQEEEIKKIKKLIDKNTDNWATSIGKSIDKVGDKLRDLSNMFNLESMANNMLEQNARSKTAIMNSVNKQFGFTSSSQFESFKNSLNDTLKDMNRDMGNIFNSSDMKEYMANLSTYGITDTKLAQEQMRSSVIANKYLGVSVETQTAIFKYMKLTNNNDTLNNYNKMIVGLLKSDLGVSREQLDALTQMATADQDALMASGMSAETYAKYVEQYDVAGAVLKSMYGDATADAIMKSISDLAQSSYADAERLIANYGPYAVQSMEIVKNTGDVLKAIQLMSGSAGNWLQGSGNNVTNATVQSMMGATNPAALVGYNRLQGDFGEFSGTTKDILSGLKDISDLDVESYVEETTQTTKLEELYNIIDTWLNGQSWKTYITLANLAFTAYLASSAFKLFGYLKDLKLGKLLTKNLGDGSILSDGSKQMSLFTSGGTKAGSALGMLGTGLAVVGLTAGTISALGSYFSSKWNESYGNQYKENYNALNGTSLQGNSAVATADTVISASQSQTALGEGMSNTYNGLKYGLTKLSTKDKHTLNKDLTEWMTKGGVFNTRDSVLAWALLMDLSGTLSDINSLGFKFSRDDIGKYMADAANKGSINEFWQTVADVLGAGWHPYIDNKGGRINNYDDFKSHYYGSAYDNDSFWETHGYEGYHKNGKEYIPKDNYKALLHKGEMVLNAKEAKFYRQMFPYGGDSDKVPREKGRIITGLPWTMTAGYPSYPSGNQHRGVDFGIGIGTPIGAAISGTVVGADSSVNYNTYGSGIRSFGQYVLVKGDNGLYYRYGHLSKIGVVNGQQIKTGDTIGLSGNTGYSTGPHLHFQVQTGTANNTDISPYSYITPGLFQAKGDINIPELTNGKASSGTEDGTIRLRTRRFIPTAFKSNTGGIGGGEINSAVDSGINKIINYLDSVRAEQTEQRKLINAFAKSRSTELTL